MRRLVVAALAGALLATGVLGAMPAQSMPAAPGLDGGMRAAGPAGPADAFAETTAPSSPVLLAQGWATLANISNSAGPSGSPVLAVDSAGTVHLAWYDNPDNWEVLYAARAITGAWGLPENVSRNASFSLVPALAVERNDTLDVVWQDYGGPSRLAWQGTLVHRTRPAGSDFEPQLVISNTTGFGGYPEVRDPSLAVDSHNTVHLAWAGNTASGYRLFYANRPAGGIWSVPRVINAGSGSSYHPHLAVDSADVLHIVWQDTAGADTQADISYSYRMSTGAWAAPASISRNEGESQEPWLLIGAGDVLHVVWRDYTPDADQAEILYATTAGAGNWTAATIISQTPGDSDGPVIVEDADRTLHLVWYDNTPGNWDILYASKPLDGSWTSGANVSNTAGRSGQPSLVYDVRGKLHLAWADDSLGQFEIYYTSKALPVFGTSYKTAPAAALAGETLAYQLTLRNPSSLPVNLFVTDTVPVETSYVAGSASADAGTVLFVAGAVQWTGVVPAGGQVVISFLAATPSSLPVGTVIRNAAAISDAGGTAVSVEASTRVFLTRVLTPLIMSSF